MLAGQQRGHRGVHPAAHRHQHPAVIARDRRIGAGGGAERAVQRVGDQVGGVELARRQAAELGGDGLRAHARGVEHVRAVEQRDRGRAGRRHRPAAGSLEARAHHPLAFDGEREADQVTARGAPRGAVVRAGRADAQPGGMLEVLAEGLHEHRV